MIAVHVPIWKRPHVTSVFMKYLERVSNQFDLTPVIIGSEGETSREMAGDFHYVESVNEPLGLKLQTGIKYIRSLNPDTVICTGSDDFICDDLWRYLIEKAKTKDFIGSVDFCMYEPKLKKGIYWSGYEGVRQGEPIGCYRTLSKKFLQLNSWRIWNPQASRSQDRAMFEKVNKDTKTHIYCHQNIGVMVDVKTKDNITKFDLYENGEYISVDRFNKIPEIALL